MKKFKVYLLEVIGNVLVNRVEKGNWFLYKINVWHWQLTVTDQQLRDTNPDYYA